MRILLYLISTFWLTSLGYAQDIYAIDFNEDGSTDTLDISTFEYTDGKTGYIYTFDGHGNFSDFMDFIPIPLGISSYPEIIAALEEKLFSRKEKSKDDPALDWLIKAYQLREEPDSLSMYSTFYPVSLQWHPWPAQFPRVLYRQISADIANLPHSEFEEEEEIPEFEKGWLIYYGHNHRRSEHGKFQLDFKEIIRNDSLIIYKTSHGLIMRKNDQYAWIFHSNGSLTGGPGKLRWSSIGSVFLYNDHVVLHHKTYVTGVQKIFIISTKTGKVGQVSLPKGFTYNSNDCYSVNLEGNILKINSGIDEMCERQEGENEALEFELDKLILGLE